MVGLNIWTKGNLRIFCIVIGMGVGYTLSMVTGILNPVHLQHVLESDRVDVPLADHPGWSFTTEMLLPFLIAVLCSSQSGYPGDSTGAMSASIKNATQ
jgi:xanthine permease XanP